MSFRKVYKGRNPSPPAGYENFDYLANANKILFLKPSHCKTYKELPSLDYFKEVLLCYKVEKLTSKKHPELKSVPKSPEIENELKESTSEGKGENSMDHVSPSKAQLIEPFENPIIVSHSKPKTKIVSDKRKKEIETLKLISDVTLTKVCPVVEFSKALLKDNDLRNKLNAKKELRGHELSKHCSRRNQEEGYLSDSARRNKTNEKKEDSSEHRKCKTHEKKEDSSEHRKYKTHEKKEASSEHSKSKTLRRKRSADILRGHELKRYVRSFRHMSDESSDESEYSYKSRKSCKRLKSKDRSERKSDHKGSRCHSDSGGSDASIKIIASKICQDTKAKKDDSDIELLGLKVVKNEVKEQPKEKTNSSDRRKVCPKPVQQNPSGSEDPYVDEDIEISAGVFGGSESFYCKVCQLNLNGIACYETHMNGKKHKKALNAQILRPEALLYQVIGNHKKDPSFMQALNRNVKMTKSNAKSQFQTMIDMYHDNPLPGLNYIDEIHAKEGINYYCELCEAPCMPASILSHLLGFKHYMNFMKIIEPSYYENNKDRPKKEIERQVKKKLREHERKYGRKEVTVMKCEVDSKGFPGSPGPSLRMSYQEEDFNMNPSDNYGDYYCKICDAHMNNETMFRAHIVGKRHLKNEKKFSSGQGMSLSSSGKVRAPPKTPSVLEDMLRDVKDTPVVGLNFMRETQNSNGEYYTCFICGCCATTDVIDHLISMKHRIKFLETVNENKTIPNGISNIRELEVSTQVREDLVADVCRDIETRYGRGRVEVYI